MVDVKRRSGEEGVVFKIDFFFFIDKKEDILERAAKKAAQGIQKVYSYYQSPPQKHQDTK